MSDEWDLDKICEAAEAKRLKQVFRREKIIELIEALLRPDEEITLENIGIAIGQTVKRKLFIVRETDAEMHKIEKRREIEGTWITTEEELCTHIIPTKAPSVVATVTPGVGSPPRISHSPKPS